MKNNDKKGFLSSIGSLFKRSVLPGGNRDKELEEMIANDDMIISPSKQIVQNFFSNKTGVIGLITFILIFVTVFGFTLFAKYDPYQFEASLANLAPGFGYTKTDSKLQGKDIQTISSGISYSVALDSEGQVYFWGKNPIPKYPVNTIVEKTKGKKIISLASGDKHVLAVTEDNEVIGVGDKMMGQTELSYDVIDDLGADKIVKVFAGQQYSAAISDTGRLFTWGSVLPNNIDRIPAEIQGRVVDVAVAPFNLIVTLDDGTIQAIGVRGNEISNIPTELTDGSINVVKVNVATTTAMALDDQGNIHTWGSSNTGLRALPEFDGEIVDIAASKLSFNAVTDKGTVYTWGSNKYGLTEMSKSAANGSNKAIYSDYFQTYAVSEDNKVSSWGNDGFLLGSDDLGRDVAERLLQGGRITLTVGAIAMIISTVIGVVVGLFAGFYGGWLDNLLMRIAEVVSAFPFIPLAITLSAFLPMEATQAQRLGMIMVILGVIGWPGIARLVRGQILAEREKDFVLAARALGIKESRVIFKHILPSVFNFIIVNMTLGYASSLLTEAGLSYLGFGVKVPSPSWGNMLTGAGNPTVIENYWWQWLLPALCVMLTALAVNFIGDALRDAMDPKSNQK